MHADAKLAPPATLARRKRAWSLLTRVLLSLAKLRSTFIVADRAPRDRIARLTVRRADDNASLDEEPLMLPAGKQVIGLIAALLVCFAAAGIGGWVTTPKIPTWYADLAKPTWTPPDWIFAPVWTILYAMMALAAWLVWRQDGFQVAKLALALFAIQLALNSLWSALFFGLQHPAAAAVDIVLLWIAILATIVAFCRHSPWAAGLMVPYLAWVSYATALNIAIWRLNS